MTGCFFPYVIVYCYLEFKLRYLIQWRNRRWAGGQSTPRDFWPGNFWWPTGKKDENLEEKKENCKREGGKLKMEGGEFTKWGQDFFFSFFKTTKICFWSTKMEIFYREKNQEKWLWTPQKNFPVTPPDLILKTPGYGPAHNYVQKDS